jgi:chitin disaccharide deacetylase
MRSACCGIWGGFSGIAREAGIAEHRLAVTADDLGLSAAVNKGILEAHRVGCVTSASLLVNAPGFSDAVTRLPEAPDLSVGLHFNLTVGSPVAAREDVATLVDSRTGAFYPLPRLVRRTLAGLVRREEVAVECTAQLERARAAGITVTHIDGHQHVHVLPGVWGPVLARARQARIRAIRVPIEPYGSRAFRTRAAIKQLCIRSAWRVAAAADAGDDVRVAHFRGMMIQGTPHFLSCLLAVLDRLPEGVTELMVHPGYAEDDPAGWDRQPAQREVELVALCSPSLAARLSRGDITLGPLGVR